MILDRDGAVIIGAHDPSSTLGRRSRCYLVLTGLLYTSGMLMLIAIVFAAMMVGNGRSGLLVFFGALGKLLIAGLLLLIAAAII